jgi:hypothetical protein
MFGVIGDTLSTVVEHVVVNPIHNAVDVLDGLSQGELRAKAALSLGEEVVGGMLISEVVSYLSE